MCPTSIGYLERVSFGGPKGYYRYLRVPGWPGRQAGSGRYPRTWLLELPETENARANHTTEKKFEAGAVRTIFSPPSHHDPLVLFFLSPTLFSPPQQRLHPCEFSHSHLSSSSPFLSTSSAHKSITMAEEVSQTWVSACAQSLHPLHSNLRLRST